MTTALEAQGLDYVYFENADEAVGSDCDIVVAAVGESKDQSGEVASRASIIVPEEHMNVLEKLAAAGKTVVAILFNGRPLALPWIAETIPAIIEAWHPGVEAGNAIVNILYGRVNPSGKLTTTFPYVSGQCPIYYGHINTGRPGGKAKFSSKYLDTPLEPVYPFGYGLSYTTFEYSDLRVSKGKNAIEVSVIVKNTGSRAGEEIVQCYFRDAIASKRVRPVKQLADFAKEHLETGESKMIRFSIPFERLGYYDMGMNYIIEDGEFEVFAGKNSAECLSEKLNLVF